jgi:hypothetical protein
MLCAVHGIATAAAGEGAVSGLGAGKAGRNDLEDSQVLPFSQSRLPKMLCALHGLCFVWRTITFCRSCKNVVLKTSSFLGTLSSVRPGRMDSSGESARY